MRSWITQKQCRRKGVSEKQEDKKESKAGKEKVSPEKKREAFQLMERGKETIILRIKRNSDDPNLVYGRDFDDDHRTRPVVGRWVKITLRGKIIALIKESRENNRHVAI